MLSLIPYISVLVVGIQWLYPLYKSFQELGGLGKESAQAQWIIYFALNALYCVLEKMCHLHMIPLYFELKAVLFLWLVHEKTNGASFVWHNFAAQHFPLVDEPVQKFLKEKGLLAPTAAKADAQGKKFDQAQDSEGVRKRTTGEAAE